MTGKLRVRVLVATSGALVATVFALILMGCSERKDRISGQVGLPEYGKDPGAESEYQAVLLTNGLVLFGKLHDLHTAYPVLTDVYYLERVPDPSTNKPTSVLVKRGKEWHAPDRTVLNVNQIVLIEPVSKSSKIIQSIEAEKQNRTSLLRQ